MLVTWCALGAGGMGGNFASGILCTRGCGFSVISASKKVMWAKKGWAIWGCKTLLVSYCIWQGGGIMGSVPLCVFVFRHVKKAAHDAS